MESPAQHPRQAVTLVSDQDICRLVRTGEYERAIAGSAATFKALADLESDAAKKKSFADRAAQRLNQLKKEFPNSPWLGS